MRSEPFTQRHVGPETTRQTVRAFTGNVWIPVLWLVALAVGPLGWAVHAAGSSGINPPLGPYVDLKPAYFDGTSSFTTNDRVVLTPYFYWYDAYSQAHLINGDGSDALTDHPPTLTGFSYLSRAGHKTQLTDMIDAGIDVLLPVYWGEPSQRIRDQPVSAQPWSYAGIPPLIQAREELLAEGKHPPAIGMFYDTSTLQWNVANQRIDLTTDYGREWFYESVRDFFSLVPPKHWAMIDGKPVVFLYAAAFAARLDQTCIDYLRTSFARDFGGRAPFVVREISWQVQAENVYAWGGALGLKNPGVASLGPGYDHSAVPGRVPLIVNREAGAFFERNWVRFLRRPSKLVMIETWNEYHEGTDVAASKEYGRQYIELNRKYASQFKLGVRPPRPRGPYSDAKSVSVTLQTTNVESGLIQFDDADGATAAAEAGASPCRTTVPTVNAGRYIYFRIEESFKWADLMVADVEVEYFDSAGGSFGLEFDGSDPAAPFQGAYTSAKPRVQLGGGNTWKKAKFRLKDAHFANSQNGGADFRLAVGPEPFYVRWVRVVRLGVPDEAGRTLHGYQQDFAGPLGSNWVAFPAGTEAIRQADGMLGLSVSAAVSPRLLLSVQGGDSPVQEVLARVRVAGFAGENFLLGGIALGADTNSALGLDLGFAAPPQEESEVAWQAAQLAGGSIAPFVWRTNVWYWLRARHQTKRITNYPDLFGRIWPADGETAEPDTWTSWWDYYPSASARLGWSGLVAGSASTALIECDYFLLKADSLPEITARLPARKPARALLRPLSYSPTDGFRLQLTGEPDAAYFVEASTNLTDWAGPAVMTDAAGVIGYQDTSDSHAPLRLYRARVAQ